MMMMMMMSDGGGRWESDFEFALCRYKPNMSLDLRCYGYYPSLHLQLFTDVSGQRAKYTVGNIPEECRSYLHRGGSLKSRRFGIFIYVAACHSVAKSGQRYRASI